MNPNRVAVLTGVGPGLGASLARRFACGGFSLGLLARHPDFIEKLAGELSGGGVQAIGVVADVSQPGGSEVRDRAGASPPHQRREAARNDGHAWRARASAILTGIGTVKEDNPRMTVRAVDTPRQPHRVLIDSQLEVPPEAPGWVRAVEAVAKLDAKNGASEVLGDIHKSLVRSHGEAMAAYRKASGERHELLRRMMPDWRTIRETLGRVNKMVESVISRSVALDRRDQERTHAARREARDEGLRRLAGVLAPPGHAHRAVERIGAHADARAVLGRERRHGVGIARGQRADEYALDARGERGLDLLGRAEAAPDLQADAAARRQAREYRGMLGAALAVPGRVEIDHVQPARARQREAIGGFVGCQVVEEEVRGSAL